MRKTTLLLLLLIPALVRGDLFFIDGSILITNVQASFIETIAINQVENNIKVLVYPFKSFSSGSNKQIISHYTPRVTPKPDSTRVYNDELGNEVIELFFKRILSRAIKIESKFVLDNEANTFPPTNFYQYPLSKSMIKSVAVYLKKTKPTSLENINTKRLINLAEDKDNQFHVVMKVLDWVRRNIKLNLGIQNASAQSAFTSKEANHDALLNLTIAILRSLGIPARFVHGFSINKSFEIMQKDAFNQDEGFDDKQTLITPATGAKDNFIVRYPKSSYSWLEIYFPNLHWVSFDVFASYFFLPPNMIKRNVSLDSEKGHNTAFSEKDKGETKALPIHLKSFISLSKERDSVQIVAQNKADTYLMLPKLGYSDARFTENLFSKQVSKKANTIRLKEDKKELSITFSPYSLKFDDKLKQIEVRLSGDNPHKQGFFIPKQLKLTRIALPLFRFNNYPIGSAWIELQKDNNKKIIKSASKDINTMNNSGFYSFVSFNFKTPTLQKGHYTLSLKSSTKEIILWRGIFGNPYNKTKDTFYEKNSMKTFLYLDLCFKIFGTPIKKNDKKENESTSLRY